MRVLHHVQHGAILDIGARTDANPVDVATNHDARPNARELANCNVADDHRLRIDVSRRRNLRRPTAVTANHARTSRKIKQVKLTYGPTAYKEGALASVLPHAPDARSPGRSSRGKA